MSVLRTHTAAALAALLACLACSDTVDPASGSGEPLHASIAATIDSSFLRTLVVTVSLANVSHQPQTIDWSDDCVGNGSVDIHVTRNGTVVWNSALRPANPACPTQQIESSIAAGDTVRFERRVLLRDVIGDSISIGPYDIIGVPTVTSLASPSLGTPLDAGQLPIADPVIVPAGAALDGTWTGTASGLSLTLTMHWRVDSVLATGTYTTQSPLAFGCAGGTIGGTTGAMQLVAARTNDFFGGRLLFSGDEGPPFYAHLRSADSADVTVTTIDTPPCVLELRRVGP